MIELRGRLIGFRRPALPGIVRNAGSAVICHDHPLRMRGINPQSMIVAMRRAHGLETLSAIRRARNSRVEHIQCVHTPGIRKNMMKIPGALRVTVIGIDQMPAFSPVLAAVDSAFFRFDDCIHAISIRPGHRDTDAPQHAARQSMTLEPFPRHAIIAGAIQPAPRAAAGQAPRRALRFPQRGKQNVRIIRIEH